VCNCVCAAVFYPCVLPLRADTGIQTTYPDIAGVVWTNPKEIAGNRVDDDGNGRIDDISECQIIGRGAGGGGGR
jgi:hypothetical protein